MISVSEINKYLKGNPQLSVFAIILDNDNEECCVGASWKDKEGMLGLMHALDYLGNKTPERIMSLFLPIFVKWVVKGGTAAKVWDNANKLIAEKLSE